MPAKRKINDNESFYEDSSEYLSPVSTDLTENVAALIENINYLWSVRYEVMRFDDAIGITVFVDFKSRYVFKDNNKIEIIAEANGKTFVREFDLEKKSKQIFKLDLVKSGVYIKNKDIKVSCTITLYHNEYVAEDIGTDAAFGCSARPHDSVFAVGGKKFYILKQYIATWSKDFNDLFYGENADKDKEEFELTDIDEKEFVELMHIIHPSVEKKINESNVLFLLKLAACFEMPSVVSMCGAYLSDFDKLPSVGLMERLTLSDKHNISHLQVACLKNLHAKSAVEQQAFRDENRQQLKELSEGTMKNFM